MINKFQCIILIKIFTCVIRFLIGNDACSQILRKLSSGRIKDVLNFFVARTGYDLRQVKEIVGNDSNTFFPAVVGVPLSTTIPRLCSVFAWDLCGCVTNKRDARETSHALTKLNWCKKAKIISP
jgi:hypothetical protein